MGDFTGILIPVAELAGVMVACVALVSLLVWGILLVLRQVGDTGMVRSYAVLLATRILVGYRREGRDLLNSLFPVSSQNFIAMVGTALGVWDLLVVLSVMGGFEADLKSKIVRHSPHVTLRPADTGAGIAKERVESLRSAAGQEVVEAYIEGEAMVTAPTNMSPGMVLRGLDLDGALARRWLAPSASAAVLRALARPVLLTPDREMGFTKRPGGEEDSRVEKTPGDRAMPEIPTSSGRRGRVLPGIVLGEELARSLSVSPGDEVIVVVPDGDVGPTGVKPRTRTFRVAGTFMSGLYEYDLKMAYTTLAEAKALFLLGGPNRVAVLLSDVDHLEEAAAGVQATLPSDSGIEVVTVARTNRSLFSALKVEKVAMFLVLGLVILVAAFNVFGSLELITMEKTRDIAVIRSLGATGRGVMGTFLALGGVIGLTGTVAGLLLGLGSCAYIALTGIRLPAEYYLRTLPVEVRPAEVVLVALAALGFSLAATVLPALAAGRLVPAEGLRND